MKDLLITHSQYKLPQNLIYGFIGKNSFFDSCQYKGKSKEAQVNREKILELLGINEGFLSILNQVHGSKAVIIKDRVEPGQEIQADGQVTNRKNVVLAIQTADCVPIFFIDLKNKVIGAAHAGWKGALAGIIDSTFSMMKKLNAEEKYVDIMIGPCIHQNSYEVDKYFFAKFINESHENEKFFCDSVNKEHYMFDLPGYVKNKLMLYNFNQIMDINIDTLQDEKNFFSYRRCALQNQKLDGHILSIVGLTND